MLKNWRYIKYYQIDLNSSIIIRSSCNRVEFNLLILNYMTSKLTQCPHALLLVNGNGHWCFGGYIFMYMYVKG